MLLDEAIEVAGADMLYCAQRAEEYREGARAFNERLADTPTPIAAEFLRQRADDFLRRAARRELSAQALQVVIDAARKAAREETKNGDVSA